MKLTRMFYYDEVHAIGETIGHNLKRNVNLVEDVMQ